MLTENVCKDLNGKLNEMSNHQRYALCIGNDKYAKIDKLNFAVADAMAIAEKLKHLGFYVDVLSDLNNEDMNKISGISNKLKEFDTVLFYYAGHGLQKNGENYLVPIDFDNDTDSDIKHSAYPLASLIYWLKQYPQGTKIVILDACRQEKGARGGGDSFSPIFAPQGTIIAFATSPGQSAQEENGHGIYTFFLLKHLEDACISIETMFKRVRTELAEKTEGRQISWEHTSLIGDFQFNPNVSFKGIEYSSKAMADASFVFVRGSQISGIVKKLKSCSWGPQEHAMAQVKNIIYENARADELFVLGRNIYQASCGKSFACRNFINDFTSVNYIPSEAKTHILNGMAFEIYYNRQGDLRRYLKWEYSKRVLSLLESEWFNGSRDFIVNCLKNEQWIVYVPGQNDRVNVQVIVTCANNGIVISDIIVNKRSYYCELCSYSKPSEKECVRELTKFEFESEIQKELVIMNGYIVLLSM